jgi:hypothetical protein
MTIPDFSDADFAVARLRGPLLGELRGRPRRSRRPLRIALPALAALVVALVAVVPRSSPALAVDRPGGVLELRIADATASPEQLTEELRAAGIRGDVRLIAVPRRTGRRGLRLRRPPVPAWTVRPLIAYAFTFRHAVPIQGMSASEGAPRAETSQTSPSHTCLIC